MVTSLFRSLSTLWPRMRERTVLRTYNEGEFHQQCMLLAADTPTRPSSAVCVAGGVLPSPTTTSRMQEGCFMNGMIGYATSLQLDYSNCR